MNELMDVELNELVSLVSEIDYEGDGFQLLQRAGALAFNDLVEEFTRTGTCKNKALLALVLCAWRTYKLGIMQWDLQLPKTLKPLVQCGDGC